MKAALLASARRMPAPPFRRAARALSFTLMAAARQWRLQRRAGGPLLAAQHGQRQVRAYYGI